MDPSAEQTTNLGGLTPKDLSLVRAGNLLVAFADGRRQGVNLGGDPNWQVTAAINPGRDEQEQRLLLQFANSQSGEETDTWRISSLGLEVGYDAGQGVLLVGFTAIGQPRGEMAGNILALRIAHSSQVRPAEIRVLEGILGLLAGDENYQLRGDPQRVLEQIPEVKKLPLPGEKPKPMTKPELSPAAVPESVAPAPAAAPREAAPETEVGPKSECRLMEIAGRANEDRARVLSVNPGENPWGISFLGGVFDGHSLGKTAGLLAENALPVFWQFLQKSSGKDLEKAIRLAAVQTNEDLIRRFGAYSDGVCFEMVLWTKEGLCLLHLGDGQAFCQKPEGVESLNFAPHHPPDGGRVGGSLAVNHSWGDEEIRRIVGEEALSPFPNIRFLSWEQLKKQGITALFLTTDGLLEQRLGGGRLAVEAVASGLGPAFQSTVRQEMQSLNALVAERNRSKPSGKHEPPADDVSGLLLSWKNG